MIQTRIVWVEGNHTDHLTTTTAPICSNLKTGSGRLWSSHTNNLIRNENFIAIVKPNLIQSTVAHQQVKKEFP